MNIEFEPDFAKKILYVSFREETRLSSPAEVLEWRRQWMEALKLWHCPYKALVDCSFLHISEDPEVQKTLERSFHFLKGLFLKKALGFGLKAGAGHEFLPFTVYPTEEEASSELGIREKRAPGSAETLDFRAQIQLENRFEQKVVELSFLGPVQLDKEKLPTLKSKLVNNLMQWHSGWGLLIDCSQFEIPLELHPDFLQLVKSLKGFFLTEIVGHNFAAGKKQEDYPFPVYRARHRAAAILKNFEGLNSGREARCQK
ncbi:MAG: hypothetical protein KA436_05320 [Oligoflexales bacterium]|nr:hypothetical protein [Oligoflexales bacterium]